MVGQIERLSLSDLGLGRKGYLIPPLACRYLRREGREGVREGHLSVVPVGREGCVRVFRMTGSGLKETTAANYRRYIERNIVPSGLGAMKVTDIRRHHINAFAADLIKAGRGA